MKLELKRVKKLLSHFAELKRHFGDLNAIKVKRISSAKTKNCGDPFGQVSDKIDRLSLG